MPVNMRTLDRVCLVIVIIVSVSCGYWVTNNLIKQKRDTDRSKGLLSRQLNDLRLAEGSVEELNAALARRNSSLQTIRKRIPESAELGKLIKRLDAMIKAREIDLLNLQPMQSVRERLCTRIPVRLLFKGRFKDVYRLIRDLEDMDRTVRMDRIAITPVEPGRTCRVDLMASVFAR